MSNLQEQKGKFKEISGYDVDELEWDVTGWHEIHWTSISAKKGILKINLFKDEIYLHEAHFATVSGDFKALFKYIIGKTPYQPKTKTIEVEAQLFWNDDGEQICGNRNTLSTCRFMSMQNHHTGFCQLCNSDCLLSIESKVFDDCPLKVERREVTE